MFDGRRLALSPRELSLLVCLARSPGVAIPHGALLEKLGRGAIRSDVNAIQVHIANLRQKLGDAATMIETVRGVGYRLSLDRT